MGKNLSISSSGKRQREFMLPDGCSCGAIVMRELDGNDDLQIAVWVEKASTPAIEENAMALLRLERTEAIRCALVSVDGEAVNLNGLPFKGMDGWTRRTMQFVGTAFNALNGAEAGELKKFAAGDQGGATPAKNGESRATHTAAPNAD